MPELACVNGLFESSVERNALTNGSTAATAVGLPIVPAAGAAQPLTPGEHGIAVPYQVVCAALVVLVIVVSSTGRSRSVTFGRNAPCIESDCANFVRLSRA